MDQIHIGFDNKEEKHFTCWTKVKNYNSISENRKTYVCTDIINEDISFTPWVVINRESRYGKNLSRMIELNKSNSYIIDFITSIVVKEKGYKFIKPFIEQIAKRQYKMGKTDLQKEMRNILGIE